MEASVSTVVYRSRGILAALLIGLVWLGCSENRGAPTAPDDFEPSFQAGRAYLAPAIAAQERHTDNLMSIDGVVGTAVGLGRDGNAVVKVYLRSGQAAGVPLSLGGFGIDAEVIGEIVALQRAQKRCPSPPCKDGGGGGGGDGDPVDPTVRLPRPVPIGVSTGHPSITAGTIGARVTDGTDVFALSNNHVYAASNAAGIGDDVIQPGTFDGGASPADDIGTLADFEPIVFSLAANNVMDAAIASTTTALLGNATPSDGYGTPLSTPMPPAVNQDVMKYGRTTRQTNGKVNGINATVNVNYGAPGVARFVGQIVITPGSFSEGGDSGSLIVVRGKGRNKTDNGKPVGLLFAGSTFSTIANPIGPVLARFGVTIDGN
jgi:hypothetical protein